MRPEILAINECDFANIVTEDIDRMGMSYFEATRLWETATIGHELEKELNKKSWLVPQWYVYARILIRRLKHLKTPPDLK